MDKIKRIIAIIAIVVIAISAILTLVFALLYNFVGGSFYESAWKASAWAMITIPLLLYAMLLIYKLVDKRNK